LSNVELELVVVDSDQPRGICNARGRVVDNDVIDSGDAAMLHDNLLDPRRIDVEHR
jgi:hypothetical protein